MGIDIVTNIKLSGNENEIKSFINDYLFLSNEEVLIWDCHDFLIENYPNIMDKFDKSINATGGRVKINKDKNIITLTSKYGYCEEILKIISHYYKNLILDIVYFDETLELNYGILLIKGGDIYNDEYISISKVEDSLIRNIEKEVPIIKNHLCFMGEEEEISDILKNISFILNDIEFVNFRKEGTLILFDTKNKSAKDKILDKLNYEFKDVLFTFNFNEKNNKYFGFNTILNSVPILEDFVSFSFDKFGYISINNCRNEEEYWSIDN